MKKYGKSTKRGFTLVELIVVLVILAVLAAMLIPALTGYIRRAREEKEFQAASTVYTAVQAQATAVYGKYGLTANSNKDIDVTKIDLDDIEELTDLENKITYLSIKVDGAKVTDITVQFDGGTKYYTYSAGASTWESDDSPSANCVSNIVR